MKKQLFLLLSLILGAAPATAKCTNKPVVTLTSKLASLGVAVAGSAVVYSLTKHIEQVLDHKRAKEVYYHTTYKKAYNRAFSEAEKLIADKTLVVPANQKRDVFIADVIEVAISEKNVLTEKLSEETIDALQNKDYAFPEPGAVAASIMVSLGLHGIAAYTLYEMAKFFIQQD